MRQDKFARDVDFEGDKLLSIPERFPSSVLHVFETETGAFDDARRKNTCTAPYIEKSERLLEAKVNVRLHKSIERLKPRFQSLERLSPARELIFGTRHKEIRACLSANEAQPNDTARKIGLLCSG